MDQAFGWIMSNGGICTEDDYPYTSQSGQSSACLTTCTPAVTITGHEDVEPGSEDALLEAVSQQPVSVAIEADQTAFQMYSSGVFSSTACGKQLDHGVLAVGYGTSEDGRDYWKVKNSWGQSWGMDGYILMERGIDICGIADSASYPTGASAATASDSFPALRR